jgi:hypothetical protein
MDHLDRARRCETEYSRLKELMALPSDELVERSQRYWRLAEAYGAEIGKLLGLMRDLAKSVEAKQKLDAGFGGMGVNILQEDAGKIHLHLREVKKYLGQQEKDCDCFAPMHWLFPEGGRCPKCGGHIPPTKKEEECSE